MIPHIIATLQAWIVLGDNLFGSDYRRSLRSNFLGNRQTSLYDGVALDIDGGNEHFIPPTEYPIFVNLLFGISAERLKPRFCGRENEVIGKP